MVEPLCLKIARIACSASGGVVLQIKNEVRGNFLFCSVCLGETSVVSPFQRSESIVSPIQIAQRQKLAQYDSIEICNVQIIMF